MMSAVFKKISLFAVFISPFVVTTYYCHLANAETAENLKPTLFVYFERDTIRESDSVKAEISLSNNADYPLNEMNLSVSLPNFLTLQCEPKDSDCLNLGSLEAHSTTSRSLTIKSQPEVEIGDYKIAFIVNYKWITQTSGSQPINGKSFVVAEQPLSVKFLGSDSIAGVPLAIATIIVPGLSCLLVLMLMRIPWSTEWLLGEKMLYSVLISIVILTLGSKVIPSQLNPGRVISIDILATLSIGGVVIGLAVGAIYWIVVVGLQAHQNKQELKLRINPEDENYELLEKMLSLNKNINSHPKALIRLNNIDQYGNDQYVGSLAVKQNEQYWLVGWFKISPPESSQQELKKVEKFKKEINKSLRKGKNLDAIRVAHNHKFVLDIKESIFSIGNDSSEMSTGNKMMQWDQSEVSELWFNPDRGDLPILELSQNNTSSSEGTAGT